MGIPLRSRGVLAYCDLRLQVKRLGIPRCSRIYVDKIFLPLLKKVTKKIKKVTKKNSRKLQEKKLQKKLKKLQKKIVESYKKKSYKKN